MAKKKKKGKKEKKLKKLKASIPSTVIVPSSPVIVESSPVKEKINLIAKSLLDANTYKDVVSATKMWDELQKEYFSGNRALVEEKAFGFWGLNEVFGTQPQGTTFWQNFSPFGLYTHLGENYWPFYCCREEFRKEILDDGFILVGNKKREKEISALQITELRVTIVDHLKTYGNCWIKLSKNAMGSSKWDILLPQYMKPKIAKDGRTIIGWFYQINGTQSIFYDINQLIHVKYKPSLRHKQLGTPPLGCLLVDIEADIQGSMYNNLVFTKGGLFGYAILMDAPKPGISTNNSALVRQMEQDLRANHSGARSGLDGIILQGAKDIVKMNDLPTLDGAFHKGSDKVTKQVCHVLGIPHEALGIITNANQQYHAASLEDKAALQKDKSINEVLIPADLAINSQILPGLGIDDAKIMAKKRYNALTRTATQSMTDIAACDGVMTVDEARQEILHLPPLGGTAGSRVLKLNPKVSASMEAAPPDRTDVPIPTQDQPIEGN